MVALPSDVGAFPLADKSFRPDDEEIRTVMGRVMGDMLGEFTKEHSRRRPNAPYVCYVYCVVLTMYRV